jgi:hypothetical protein
MDQLSTWLKRVSKKLIFKKSSEYVCVMMTENNSRVFFLIILSVHTGDYIRLKSHGSHRPTINMVKTSI